MNMSHAAILTARETCRYREAHIYGKWLCVAVVFQLGFTGIRFSVAAAAKIVFRGCDGMVQLWLKSCLMVMTEQ